MKAREVKRAKLVAKYAAKKAALKEAGVHFISGRGGERVGMKKLSRRAVSSDL